MEQGIILEMKGINKSFFGINALNNVFLDVKKGEIHAICGENGAGKSTLMKILNGVYSADSGEIWLKGQKADVSSPLQAQRCGLSIIFQEFNLIDSLSVAENIFLGRLKTKNGKILWQEVCNDAKSLLERIGGNINPLTLVGQLSTSQKQMVEIVKALSYNAEIIVMDEPTASLTDAEVNVLYRIIAELKDRQISIIYISHKMAEIFTLADRITVLRDGSVISTTSASLTNRDEVISQMVGRSVDLEFPRRAETAEQDTVLEVNSLNTKMLLKDISFTLKKGEILGIAGLVGSGRTELVRAIFGADESQSQSIFISGKQAKIKNPLHAIRHKLALLTEDRKQQGLLVNFGINKNITATDLKKTSRFGFINTMKEDDFAKKYVDILSIKTPSIKQKCIFLSGGNQQKVVLAKWLYSDAEIIILDEPTRGIDVGSKYEIYLLMNKLVEEGKSIIMISSELPEILGMSDRILVMHTGRLRGELDNSTRTVTPEQIMQKAIG